MALKLLRCCCGASSPEQGSVLRAIHPINSHKKHTRLLGGLSLIDLTRRHARLALEWVSRAPYLAAAAMVVWVWPRQLLTIFPQGEPQQIGDRQKAFSVDNRFLLVWDVSSVVIKEKR